MSRVTLSLSAASVLMLFEIRLGDGSAEAGHVEAALSAALASANAASELLGVLIQQAPLVTQVASFTSLSTALPTLPPPLQPSAPLLHTQRRLQQQRGGRNWAPSHRHRPQPPEVKPGIEVPVLKSKRRHIEALSSNSKERLGGPRRTKDRGAGNSTLRAAPVSSLQIEGGSTSFIMLLERPLQHTPG